MPVNIVLGVIDSFILLRVSGQFIVCLKLFSNGNCPYIGIQIQCSMQILRLKKNIEPGIICTLKNTLLQRVAQTITDEPE